jgi:hypothetical protein
MVRVDLKLQMYDLFQIADDLSMESIEKLVELATALKAIEAQRTQPTLLLLTRSGEI